MPGERAVDSIAASVRDAVHGRERGAGRMAYRFLLEVPENLAAEANIAVSEAGDAQVVVVRNSHALDFDQAYVDLTIAAHSLRVVNTLYTWFDDLGASRPDLRIVLHSGEELELEKTERGQMVAAIRRDQPWVERTIPMIGEHEPESILPEDEAAAPAPRAATAVATEPTWGVVAPVVESAGAFQIRALNHVGVRVTDLERAENFYRDFLSMDVVARARLNPDGTAVALGPDYSWTVANADGHGATISFLRNGPLVLSIQQLGRGARIERGVLDHISIRVDAAAFTNLKGQILMRSMETLVSEETRVIFRDPFFVTWELTLQSLPAFVS
jgi:catechol 2,3-dioxygenase-like lactoylglutathione lyase family enzyme